MSAVCGPRLQSSAEEEAKHIGGGKIGNWKAGEKRKTGEQQPSRGEKEGCRAAELQPAAAEASSRNSGGGRRNRRRREGRRWRREGPEAVFAVVVAG
ncbi:hypothetical protein LXL04_001614 [Taraxacum kok-saghyz]